MTVWSYELADITKCHVFLPRDAISGLYSQKTLAAASLTSKLHHYKFILLLCRDKTTLNKNTKALPKYLWL